MGNFFSGLFSESNDLESGFESITVRSISFGNDESKTAARSISFNSRDLEPTIMKSLGSGKMMIEGSISFKRRENETMISVLAPPPPENEKKSFVGCQILNSDGDMVMDAENLKHEAAVTLQKVYKSFRVRRKIADCAVQLVEQRWWQLLDYAELQRGSTLVFELDKQETTLSKWSRAKIRAAKVGKGLSKNGKAQKLDLRHWLEAIDPRHRYGHNLQFYYAKWLNCESTEHFFHWLDIGEGKEVNLVEKCPRWKLQQQCIKYLGPLERKTYEVVVEDGKLIFLQTGQLVDTTGDLKDDKWIFVLSTSKALYIGKKIKGTFQHSSFLAGGATISAGRLVAQNGVLKAIWRHSGHYQPTEENFNDFISFLIENNVELSEVKMSPDEGEEEHIFNKERSNVYKEPVNQNTTILQPEETNVEETKNVRVLDNEEPTVDENGYESAEEEGYVSDQEDLLTPKQNLFEEEENITKESLLQRIDSCKGLSSYRLGKQLSGSWTSGTGPRIGCVGEYPSELRIRALEHVNLSPRCTQNS